MLARLLDRLTYANVVATLALFIALGGSAYAVGEINSRDVKNRSLKGGDIKLNTLTGKEINERKLGTVPLARQADNAGTADISKSAGTATTAGSAGTAELANVARDAQTLAGQGASAFESSAIVSFGKAPVNPASSSDEQTVLSWPELGVAVTTTDQGPCGGDLGVSFRNTRSSGAPLEVFQVGPGDSTANPGGETNVCSDADPALLHATATDTSGRALFVDCIRAGGEVRCIGVRGE
jgi:hypothetical protein